MVNKERRERCLGVSAASVWSCEREIRKRERRCPRERE
jgi:hypothetical protein